ncbi:hypothetical protein [Treponema endosymbiont of Eucomonympha sp.]|uniref:hypothetical protein n=2 Tax=Treponema endosymbiont of Eucomonympha sp. TaxID=1580831 RepID=UPI00139680F9|nr:hypothetical protein [Treponema endosymbiont of Eucomonympha sp.]
MSLRGGGGRSGAGVFGQGARRRQADVRGGGSARPEQPEAVSGARAAYPAGGGFAEEVLYPLRDLLLSQTGQCAVYFHAETEGQPVTVKTPLAVPGTGAFIEVLKEHPLVESVWKE